MIGAPPRIKVMIVEDSETVTQLLKHVIAADPRLAVVGAAQSGEEALALLDRLRPDVVTMDVRLPGIDGIETTRRIMKRRPTPIVVVAAGANADGRISIDALRAGALSVVEKPRGVSSADFQGLALRLCRQLVLMSELKLVRQRRTERLGAPARRSSPARIRAAGIEGVGLVASTGGPNAIAEILAGLGADFPAPIFVVQHITPSFCESFVAWLNDSAPMPVAVARHGDEPKSGVAYVAPPDGHLEVAARRLSISRKPPLSSQRPSGTLLFQSMSKAYGAASIGVLLTGMGDDGAAGLGALYDIGAHTIAECEETAVVFGMPAAAIALGAASETLPLPAIAPRLRQLAACPVRAAS